MGDKELNQNDGIKLPPMVVLSGPTGVGKTKLSIQLAKAIDGEIISADSMQVYHFMDIGSAKIMTDEMQGVPHHLINVLMPWEEFNVVTFQTLCKEALQGIYERGHIPIVVGGTGFYVQALLRDINFTENEDDSEYRKRLEEKARTDGPEALHEMLKKVDPESAEAIHANNIKRTIRALEYYHLTGSPISEHNETERQRDRAYNCAYFVLNDLRERLYERIEQRVDEMIKAGLVDEVKREGNIILFIDEVHNIVGAGKTEGSMDAGNLLKPKLARGELHCIGATTLDEYRKYLEKDAALERRFQPVTVNEPTIEDTVDVLVGIKKYYEKFHRVHISDYLVRVCAVLSERYITDRFLPDKAIDLLDESCAYASIRSPEIGDYEKCKKEIKVLEDMEESISEQEEIDYKALAEVKGKLIHLRENAEELRAKAENVNVEESDVTKVVERWTGIPASKIAENDFLKIARLDEALKKRIVGQEEAVGVLTKAIKRTRVQLSKRRRPASFIFVGPTGVGKTELVKVLAEELFDSPDPLIRLDMTEYMEKHSVARMIGSPPGYVGYDEAGQLTEKVRRKPYSVILFDEIEKAHPDVMNILMQILDEGKVDDAHGRTVNFANTIICMTSNAGSTDKSIGVGFNRTENEITREKAMKGLRDFLRPEFISRIDEIVVFKDLTKEHYADIAALTLDEMKEPLAEKNISLEYTKDALNLIAEKSFGKSYGARDIRRVIRQEIEDSIADLIIEKVSEINKIVISVKDGSFTVTGRKEKSKNEA